MDMLVSLRSLCDQWRPSSRRQMGVTIGSANNPHGGLAAAPRARDCTPVDCALCLAHDRMTAFKWPADSLECTRIRVVRLFASEQNQRWWAQERHCPPWRREPAKWRTGLGPLAHFLRDFALNE